MEVTDVMYSYGLCVFSIILVGVILYLQLKVNKSMLRQWCIMILTCALISNISVMFQIVNVSKVNTWIWYRAFCNIGESLLPTCLFFTILNFVKPEFKFKTKYLLLFIMPVLSTILTFTNNYHQLMFEELSLRIAGCRYGPLFYVNFVYIVIIYLISFIILLKYLVDNFRQYSTQLFLGVIFFGFPYMLNILSVLQFFNLRIYVTEIFQSIMSITMILIALKYSILTEFPLSIRSILDTVTNAFIVIDEKGKIVSYNAIFLNMFNLGKLNIKGMDIKELIEFKEFDTIFDEDIDKILALNPVDDDFKVEFERSSETLDRTFKYESDFLELVRKKKLYMILITDLTQYSKNVQSIKLNHDAILR